MQHLVCPSHLIFSTVFCKTGMKIPIDWLILKTNELMKQLWSKAQSSVWHMADSSALLACISSNIFLWGFPPALQYRGLLLYQQRSSVSGWILEWFWLFPYHLALEPWAFWKATLQGVKVGVLVVITQMALFFQMPAKPLKAKFPLFVLNHEQK